MKKISTLLAITMLTIASAKLQAQINKGDIALGGNLSLNTSTSKGDDGFKQTSTYLSISPSLMKFYSANKAFGINLNVGYAKSTYSELKTNSYGAGAFLRQYKSLGKNFYVFAQESFNFNYSRDLYKTDSSNFVHADNRTYQVGFTANPGLAYNFSKKFQMELIFFNNLLSASYSHTDAKTTNVKTDNFSIISNLDLSQISTLNIGAKIFLGR